jgi:hypothetical protein
MPLSRSSLHDPCHNYRLGDNTPTMSSVLNIVVTSPLLIILYAKVLPLSDDMPARLWWLTAAIMWRTFTVSSVEFMKSRYVVCPCVCM